MVVGILANHIFLSFCTSRGFNGLKKLLLQLIEQKYKEVQKKQKSGIFEKILHFEGNAIGQIGEKFVKEVFKAMNLPLDELPQEIIHDEFDLLSRGKKVEIRENRKKRLK